MPPTIESAEQRLRSLLSASSVALEDGPSRVLPVFERFCHEPVETESDMLLWEVGEFADWIETPEGDWTQGDPQWMFAICRQFERGNEIAATDEEPAGFFQVRCEWYYPPGPRSAFATWRGDETIGDFFARIVASPEMEAASTTAIHRADLAAEWV